MSCASCGTTLAGAEALLVQMYLLTSTKVQMLAVTSTKVLAY